MLTQLFSKKSKVLPGRIEFEEIAKRVNRDDAIIFEVGANNGEDTVRFLRHFPHGVIFAFEPDPRAAAGWRQQVTDDRATLVEIAIGAENGQVSFHQSDGAAGSGKEGWNLSGSIRKPKNHLSRNKDVTFPKEITVDIRTLDSWCQENNVTRIDFLRADVQGAERDLFKGAKDILVNTRFIYTEYSDKELYSGQWTLDQIATNLPNHKLIARWKNDALFELIN